MEKEKWINSSQQIAVAPLLKSTWEKVALCIEIDKRNKTQTIRPSASNGRYRPLKMKKATVIITLLVSIIQQQIASAQQENNCDLNDRIWMRSGDTIHIEEISEQDFTDYLSVAPLHFSTIQNSDSVEQVLTEIYNFITKEDSCLSVNSRNRNLKVCNINSDDFKTNYHYKFISYYKERYITIEVTGYESWTYYLLDLKEEKIYELPGEPQILEQQYIFGESVYYSHHDFKIYEIQTSDSLCFSLQRTEVRKIDFDNAVLRLKTLPWCDKNDPLKVRYYSIDLKSGL